MCEEKIFICPHCGKEITQIQFMKRNEYFIHKHLKDMKEKYLEEG